MLVWVLSAVGAVWIGSSAAKSRDKRSEWFLWALFGAAIPKLVFYMFDVALAQMV